MDVTILGGGYVGVTTGVVMAEAGHDVTVVEVDDDRRKALADGRAPFHEPGLDDALADALDDELTVTDEIEPADVVLVCVGTPSRDDGSADLSQLVGAVDDLAAEIPAWDGRPTVAVKSTVPPGTTRRVVRPTLEDDADLAVNPEFLREANALPDARDPDRIVVGTFHDAAEQAMRTLYADRAAPKVFTTPETAELVKYASNALLATKISFANEIARLAEELGVDVDEAVKAVGLDHRIDPAFLGAGLGFGGSCFPKDVRALRHVARELDVEPRMLDAVVATNEDQPLWAVRHARRILDDLDGRRIAVLGLAFKPGTSDVRGSRAIPIVEALADEGADVHAHDPRAEAGQTFAARVDAEVTLADTAKQALDDADACIVQTAWPTYREIPPATFRKLMRTPVVLDGRRHLDAQALGEADVTYRALGRGDLPDDTEERTQP